MQYDQKIKTVFSAQNNDFTILREHRMGRQGIIYSDITRGGGGGGVKPTHLTQLLAIKVFYTWGFIPLNPTF